MGHLEQAEGGSGSLWNEAQPAWNRKSMARDGQDERQPCGPLPSPACLLTLLCSSAQELCVAEEFLLFSLSEEDAGVLSPLGIWQIQSKGS